MMSSNTNSNTCPLRRRLSLLIQFTVFIILLQTPFVWTFTWTTNRDVVSSISSRVTRQQQQQQRISTIDDIISTARKDQKRLTTKTTTTTTLKESQNDNNENQGLTFTSLTRRWNRSRFRLRYPYQRRRQDREDSTRLFASDNDNNDDIDDHDVVNNDNQENQNIPNTESHQDDGDDDDDASEPKQQAFAANSNNEQVNEFVQKAQQAWTSSPSSSPSSSSIPPPKIITRNKLNKTGARESLLNSYKGGKAPSIIGAKGGTLVGNENKAKGPLKGTSSSISSIGSKGILPPKAKGIPPSSSPFTTGIPNGMPKKMMAASKSYGGKWGSVSKGGTAVGKGGFGGNMKSFSDGIAAASKGGPTSKTSVDKGSAFSKSSISGDIISPPPIMKGANPKGTVQPPPPRLPLKAAVAKSPSEFLKEFAKSNAPPFMPKGKGDTTAIKTNSGISSSSNTNNDSKDSNANEEAKYLTVAKEAWSKFFSSQISQEDYVSMALDAWRGASSVKSRQENDEVDAVSQLDTPSAGVKEENGDETTTTEKKEGAAGASFFSGLTKSLFPGANKSTPSKSPAVKTGGNYGESLETSINSIKKGKSLGEKKQVTPPPLPLLKKGVAPPMKSLGEKKKQITPTSLPLMKKGIVPPTNSLGKKEIVPPPLSIKKGIAPPKQLDTAAKKNWQGNRGGLSFLTSDKLSNEYKADKNYNPMNKAVTVEKIKGMKGKDTSISGGKKQSSTLPPSLNKRGVKLGIKGKFASKKLETAAKKNWQGNRGGLSFLKSDKLTADYKADKNYNPMNKAVTVEKISRLKIGLSGKAKSDDDTEESSENDTEEPKELEDDEQLETATLESALELSSTPPNEAAAEASKIEKWNKESFKPTLKGSESAPATDTDVDEESDLSEGKTTTISITDQGGTDVVNPGRAFIPAPRATEDKTGIGGSVKFASTKLGFKGGMPLKGGAKKFGSPASGSAKLLASKSGLLKGSIGAKKFGSTSVGGFLNKKGSKKIDFSLLKKGGGISKGSKLPLQQDGGVSPENKGAPNMGLKGKGFPSKSLNDLGANDMSKSSSPGATGNAKSTLTSKSANPMSVQNDAVDTKKAAAKDTRASNAVDTAQSSATELIADGMTAEEAERIRKSRLEGKETSSSNSSTRTAANKETTKIGIEEGMTAEEAEISRISRLVLSDSLEENKEGKAEIGLKNKSGLPHFATKSTQTTPPTPTMKKGFPSAPLQMKGTLSKASDNDEASADDSSVSKGLSLKGGMSMGKQQADLPGKGMPFMKKSASFSMEKKSLPPLPLKEKGDDGGLKKGMGMPPLAKKSFGDGATASVMKKGFPSAPLKMKGPISKASDNDEESADDSSVSKGLPLKGGMSMGEKQAGLPGKGMPFMKKSASFSMEKKSLPPLPLKGKGDDGGLKKGMGMPPLAKKSFGDGATASAPVMKKGFPSAPLKMKGPIAKASDDNDDEASADDSSVSKGLPMKGGMSMGKQQAGLPGKGMPFMKKSASFSMEKKSLPPPPLKGKGDDASLKKGMGMPPLAKKSFGDGATAPPVMKKGFQSAPLKMKGPISKASDDKASADDSSVSRGLPMKGGMSMGKQQAGLPGKGMPFMEKSASFSMEKKSLPPLPLKGKGDDGGLKKGMGMPPLAKKSFGDGATAPVMKKGFPSAPLKMKGPISKASDDEASADDSSVSKGLPLKGGMSMGEKQAGPTGKGMPFMKKSASFSMEKKSLPPLPLKGKGDDGGLKKGMGMPPLAKKSFGDGTTATAPPVMKKGFPSAPLKMKGPMSKASDDEVSADDSSVAKGLPLKGGMSMGKQQAGLPGKGMPFMKKSASFSMEKKSLPPLPLKGKGDDAGLKKGMGIPPLAKKSFVDVTTATAPPVMKKGFPSAPLKMKGPMSKASDDEVSADDSSVTKGLPLKGGMSMGAKQAGLPGKGMPFMKKSASFSMEKKSLPPPPLKGKGDDASLKKGMGMPPLAKKSFGDGATAPPVMKKGFPSAPLKMKGPISKASDDEASADDSSVSKGLPMKGGMSMGKQQAGLPGKGMPFMKKSASFSMEKKSLPPLPLKGKGDDAGLKKGMGIPPLAKKSFGDVTTATAPPVMKKGFPSAPLKMKGPMSKASDDEVSADDSSVSKGFPLKGGMSMGKQQAGLPGKGMPFMKKSASFSMEKKSLPPLPLKGKGDDAGLKKGMGIPPLAKKSFGDVTTATAPPVMKKGFPSAPLKMKGPMSKASDDEVSADDSSVTKGLPLKGGMSMGAKQAGLPGKGMPFMKKSASFSMEKKSLPPPPLKGKGDDASLKKGMGMPPLAKKSFGDGATAPPVMKKGFPSAPLKMKGPISKASDDEASADDSSVSKGLPMKGGMSMGKQQAGLPGKGMPFMKKSASFSMEKKSLPPLPLKGKGDDAGLKKGMGIPPLAKKSFGDVTTATAPPVMKKGFPSAPLKMKGPMSKASDDEVSADDSSVSKGFPLKGGMSMGKQQAGLPGKGMPFMKKSASFSMEKKSLPPLPLKGKGDDAGLKKGMGIPPLAKKSFGDVTTATAPPVTKKGFPSAPLKMKGPMSKASDDEVSADDSSVAKGLPLKGGMSMGAKQAGLPGKGMPFMKKSASFSMEKKSLPPLPLKGKGDDAGLKKGMGMPSLAKKSFGDVTTATAPPVMKKGFPSAPLKMKGPMSKASDDDDDDEASADDSSVLKGLPLKGGMSMGKQQAGLPGKGMPFMKKSASFSMEKKSLPPLPLKGKGDDAGLKKGMGIPPLAKKSFGDVTTATAPPVMKKGFPSAPLKMKGPMSKASDDEVSADDSSVAKGLPLKGGMSMGAKQAGLPGKGMPFMKKSASFSMEKKSLPPLPLKGKGDDGGLKKGMGMPSLAKKSFGDVTTATAPPVMKKGFPSAPLKMKGPMSKASDDDDDGEASADDSSVLKGLPLKGGMSMGKQQAVLPGKGMPFMKKSASFSMEKKSLPPLPLKGKGDDASLKKGMGMPSLAKKSFGDGTTAPVMKKGFPSAPLKMKGPMSKVSDVDSSVLKGLPLKGGMSMVKQQAGLPGKGMPFMKKGSLSSLKDVDGGDSNYIAPAPVSVEKVGNSSTTIAVDVDGGEFGSIDSDEDDFTEDFSSSDESVSSWTSTPDKELGKGAAFLPKFSPPPMRAEPKDPNDFSWLESASAADMEAGSTRDDSDNIDDAQIKEPRRPVQPKEPVKLWGGESFLGTSSSRVYGLGSIQPSKSIGLKGNEGTRAKPSGGSDPISNKSNAEKWASDDATNAARLMDEMNESKDFNEKRLMDEKREFIIAEEKRLIEEKTKIAALLYDTEKRLSMQLEKFEEETQILKDDRARAEAERLEAERRIQDIEAARIRAEKEAERLERRFAEEKSSLSAKLSDAERARTDDEKRLIEEKTKVAALISEAEKKLALQMEKFEEERLKMNEEKERAAAERSEAHRKVTEADAARIKAEKDAQAFENLLSEQKLKQEKLIEEQRLLTEEALEKRIAEEKSKIDIASSDAKAKEEARLAEAQKQLVDAQLEQRLAEMRILEIEADRIRAEKEAERLEQRFAEEKSALSAKLSDAERARTDDEKRLVEEKTKVAALISEAEKKLALQMEKFEEERLRMNKEKERAAAERSEAQRKVTEADAARIKAENDAKALENLLSEQKLKQEKWMEEQRRLTEEALEKRIAEEKSKIDVALAEAKAKEEARLAAEQKQLVDAQLEQRLAEMRIQDIEAARIRAEKEAERLERRFAEEKSSLSAKLSDAERARTDDEKRLVEEKTKVAALISEAEKKLALQMEKFEEERLRMNKEKERAAAERSEAQRKAAEADAARIKAEKDAEAFETLLSEQKLKQEKWMDEQRLLTEEALEKRIAEEKSKIDVALVEAKAKEEARLAAEQKRQVEVQLEQRLAEEKLKLDAEIAAVEEKIRRELENLDSGKSVKEEVAAENEQEDENSTPVTASPLEEELALPDEALELSKDLPKLSSTTSDVLTADVEALELISMCQADFDATYSTDVSSSEESCLLPTDYPFVSLLRDSSPYIVNHRHSTIVYHIPGDLISDVEKFNSVMDDIALTWLFGMKIVLCVGCRTQVSHRLDKLGGRPTNLKSGVRVTTDTALRVLEEEAGFCRFEVERQLNRCLRNKGANCNVVSGCFITAKKYGVVGGVDYQHTGYPKTLQTDRINRFISRSDVVLLTPLGFTEDGQALNIKSEQLAGFTAGALKASKVVYFSTKPLVMRGSNNSRDANANQRIQMIQRSNALQILSHHGLKIHDKTGFPHWNSPTAAAKNPKVQSMLLKMGWATDALDKGVERAHIIACDDGALLEELFTARRGYGTCISQDDYEAPHPEDQNDDLLADEVGPGVIGW